MSPTEPTTVPAGLITVDVPEGMPAMSLPVKPSNRIDRSQVEISPVTEVDLLPMADAMLSCFAPMSWERMQPTASRPPPEVRRERYAKLSRAYISQPGWTFVKAVDKSTGEIAGFAGWSHPGTPIYNIFRRDAMEELGLAARMGWTPQEVDELWEGYNFSNWQAQFLSQDEDRIANMGNEPHWYLAQLMVFKEHRGRGFGTYLMEWVFEQADGKREDGGDVPCYLESALNARPVYTHHGFVPARVGAERARMVRRGPPRRLDG